MEAGSSTNLGSWATLVSASAQVPARTGRSTDPGCHGNPDSAATQSSGDLGSNGDRVAEPTGCAANQVRRQPGVGRGGPPPSASGQDSSVTLEAQTASKLHHGYTRVPNSFLMRMAAGDLVRSEMQILLLIARFTISFQRRHAPLSKAVLERQSGLRGPAVLQAVSDLLAKGLIEKIPGDQHRPNQLGLAFTDEWDFFPSPRRAVRPRSTSDPGSTKPRYLRRPWSPASQVANATPVFHGDLRPVAAPAAGVLEQTFKEKQ